jgi:hypothetical protein
LARAALEQMAGAGTLDPGAMADLAEVRWRGGDLIGAADAARAHQASGGTEPMAALIIAEDLARSGADEEASAAARTVTDRVAGAVDVLFAMEPRREIWPVADPGWMPGDADAPGHWGLLVGGSVVADPAPDTWELVPITEPQIDDSGADGDVAPQGRGVPGSPAGAGSTTAVVMTGRLAGEELDLADRALAAGDLVAASHRLAVLLRLDPALAPIILSAADRATAAASSGSGELTVIHLVRGDAYRTMGRDNEAAAAYRLAHQTLSRGSPTKESM